DNAPPRRRQGLIASILLGSPRAMLMTLAVIFIIGSLLSNNLSPEKLRARYTRPRPAPVEEPAPQAVEAPESEPVSETMPETVTEPEPEPEVQTLPAP